MQVCFIGHKKIDKNEALSSLLKETIELLIHKGATTFLFGSSGEFDHLSWEIITEVKNQHSFIKRVYVRASYPFLEKSYEEYLLKSYEETYFPSKIANAGKYSYVERNYEMIDSSTYCVFYYNKNYITRLDRNSGTKLAYEYALKKKKQIINLYK